MRNRSIDETARFFMLMVVIEARVVEFHHEQTRQLADAPTWSSTFLPHRMEVGSR